MKKNIIKVIALLIAVLCLFGCSEEKREETVVYNIKNPNDIIEKDKKVIKVAGLNRYVSAKKDINNYICFGTSNKEDCLKKTEKSMYRIIGIADNGEMKLIKKEAIHYLKSIYRWNKTCKDVTWNNSELFKNLNGESFLNNSFYVPNDFWKKLIVKSNWKYGSITSNQVEYDEEGNYRHDVNNIYSIESKWKNSVNAKIGIMYLSDYYANSEKNNWMKIENNDNIDEHKPDEIQNDFQEYFIDISEGKEVEVWSTSGLEKCNLRLYVRPTFYLSNNITFISGNGSIEDPYIIDSSN